jgi:hypothetical protein
MGIAYFQMKAKKMAKSRFQGGIHFRTNNEVALDFGKRITSEIIKKLKMDRAD